MHSPSKLRLDASPLFLDAGVVINLIASNCAEAIFAALTRPILIVDGVWEECRCQAIGGSSAQEFLKALAKMRRIQIIKMSEAQFELFLHLTGSPSPDDLGDGEAAVLACAVGTGCAVFDDTKSLRIATRDFRNTPVYSTLDVMCGEQVIRALGKPDVANAVFEAIRTARMRVPDHWRDWVSGLLGEERAAELPSLKQSDFNNLADSLPMASMKLHR